MIRRARSQRVAMAPGDAGFTLLELLVALSLLALIMASVPGLVRLVGRSVQVAGEVTRSHADRPALDTIADILAEARPVLVLSDDGKRRVKFRGTPTSVQFIAPGRIGDSGGLVSYNLEFLPNRRGRSQLMLSRTLFGVETATDQAATADVRVPLPAAYRIAFRYFGPSGDDATSSWSDTWDIGDVLPELVEITVTSARVWATGTNAVTVPLRLYQAPGVVRNR